MLRIIRMLIHGKRNNKAEAENLAALNEIKNVLTNKEYDDCVSWGNVVSAILNASYTTSNFDDIRKNYEPLQAPGKSAISDAIGLAESAAKRGLMREQAGLEAALREAKEIVAKKDI